MSILMSHPALADCRRLFLRNYKVHVRIGAHAFETLSAQRVVFNVELYVPLAQSTPAHDRLDEVLDYDFIRSTIRQRIAEGHIVLQETLCDDVLRLMLENPQVRAARVSTEKTDVYDDCDAVGCEVFGINPLPAG
ncbi:dihydroneopterin aldolase [Piscinibacter sakaiensis]|uniref:dihydroneopterin aldolase n=1 Tax=Piscinibacter sakaiensis TaxID=1547922 RepID=UPI003AAFAC10